MKGEDREFFRKIKSAAFTNPFSRERELTDLEISGLDTTRSNEEILGKLSADVFSRIKKYQNHRIGLNSEDRILYRYGVLFYLFHLFCDEYDQLIAEQIAAGEKPVAVRFAGDVLRLLEEYGFSRQDGLKFFAFFFSCAEVSTLLMRSLAKVPR